MGGHRSIAWISLIRHTRSVPNLKEKTIRKGDNSLDELNPEDFRPVTREALGTGVVRLAKLPKKKNREGW